MKIYHKERLAAITDELIVMDEPQGVAPAHAKQTRPGVRSVLEQPPTAAQMESDKYRLFVAKYTFRSTQKSRSARIFNF